MIEFKTPEGHRFALSKGVQIELSEDKINNNVRVHTVIDGENDFWHIAGTYDDAKAKIEAFENDWEVHNLKEKLNRQSDTIRDLTNLCGEKGERIADLEITVDDLKKVNIASAMLAFRKKKDHNGGGI